MSNTTIQYPYIPTTRTILYVPEDNPYMRAAKEIARTQSLDKVMPNGTVIVKNNEIIGCGANGSTYHETNGCERVRQGIPTGQKYELCEGCHPKNHGEPKALADAVGKGADTFGADLYLWGHWWCCEPCWNAMIKAEIRNVYLLENSQILFNREAPGNIVGKQFE